jgi:hypothetical protein
VRFSSGGIGVGDRVSPFEAIQPFHDSRLENLAVGTGGINGFEFMLEVVYQLQCILLALSAEADGRTGHGEVQVASQHGFVWKGRQTKQGLFCFQIGVSVYFVSSILNLVADQRVLYFVPRPACLTWTINLIWSSPPCLNTSGNIWAPGVKRGLLARPRPWTR